MKEKVMMIKKLRKKERTKEGQKKRSKEKVMEDNDNEEKKGKIVCSNRRNTL